LSCQQFCGINSIIFYGVKVIGKILPDYSIQVNFAISILNVVVTLAASAIIDHVGRRPLLLASTTVMTAMSLLISVGLTLSVSFLLVTATFVYIAAFAIGLGPIPFLIIGELSYPQDAATAQSFGTVCNWLATFIVGYLFPIGHGLMGGYVFAIFAAIAAMFATYVYKRVPETKGKTTYSEVWAGY
jgi:MFS family permease